MSIKTIIEKLLPKKRVPIRVPIRDKYDIQRDAYLLDLLNRLEQDDKSLDSDMYDKL